MDISVVPQNTSVALLCGGTSGEREISIASGKGAKAALEEAGFKVTVLDTASRDDLKRLIEEDFDVAFICLHGKRGEDGAIQGYLELLDIPYTGSSICSSALAMDKSKAKLYYEQAKIPTPAGCTIYKGKPYSIEEILTQLGDKCVIKPATEGSSLGVFIVEGEEAIEKAIADSFAYDTTTVVERYIKGDEYTVVVMGDKEPYALPIIKIIPVNDSYDFDSKYLPGGSQHICPAPISEELTERMQELAVKAHECLGCSGVSRSDFIVDEQECAWILETNTIPGMTETSLLPDAGRAAGIPFSELCTQLVQYALDRKN